MYLYSGWIVVLDLDDIRGFLDGGYATLNNTEGDLSTFVRYC